MGDFQTVHSYETVELRRDGAAALVELNRPQSLNAWNRALGDDLLAALRACRDETYRAVLVTGAGRGFSSGADLGSFGGEDGDVPAKENGRPDLERVLVERYHPIMHEVRALEKPVLAGVNGVAAGIGMSFALACDLITMSQSASLVHAFTRIGLGPDGGASLWLVARLGWTRAAGIMFGGLKVEAADALAMGLVNDVAPTEGFREAIEDRVRELAAGPTGSYRATKRAINVQVLEQMDEVLELESRAQGKLGDSDDFPAAALAVMQKVRPTFQGR